EALARLAIEPGRAVGGLSPPLDVGRLQRIDVAAGSEDRLFHGLVLDVTFGHPAERLVENVVGPHNIGVAIRTAVKPPVRHTGMRVTPVSARLLPRLPLQQRVPPS